MKFRLKIKTAGIKALLLVTLISLSACSVGYSGPSYRPPGQTSSNNAQTAPQQPQSIVAIANAWVQTPRPGESSAAVNLLLINAGDLDDELIGAQSNSARRVAIYQARTFQGQRQLTQVPAVKVPVGRRVQMTTDSVFIMLDGLTSGLNEGSSISLTLNFKQAGSVTFNVPVSATNPRMQPAPGTPGVPPTTGTPTPPPSSMPRQAQVDVTPMLATAGAVGLNSVVFLQLKNNGPATDTLIGAGSNDANRVAIVESRRMQGRVQIVEVGQVSLPPGRQVVLNNGGTFIRLEGLRRTLVAGQVISLTLQFQQAGLVQVNVPVRPGQQGQQGQQGQGGGGSPTPIGTGTSPVIVGGAPGQGQGQGQPPGQGNGGGQGQGQGQGQTPQPVVANLQVHSGFFIPDLTNPTQGYVYLTIVNPSGQNDQLRNVGLVGSGMAEAGRMQRQGNRQRHMAVSNMSIKGGETLVLQPGGFHIWVQNLPAPLAPGSLLQLVLTFKNAGDILVSAQVQSATN